MAMQFINNKELGWENKYRGQLRISAFFQKPAFKDALNRSLGTTEA